MLACCSGFHGSLGSMIFLLIFSPGPSIHCVPRPPRAHAGELRATEEGAPRPRQPRQPKLWRGSRHRAPRPVVPRGPPGVPALAGDKPAQSGDSRYGNRRRLQPTTPPMAPTVGPGGGTWGHMLPWPFPLTSHALAREAPARPGALVPRGWPERAVADASPTGTYYITTTGW